MAIDIKSTVKKAITTAEPAVSNSLGTVASGMAADTKSAAAVKNQTEQQQRPELETPDYAINYNDERFKNVEKDKQTAIDKSNQIYDNMIGQSDSFYQGLIDETVRYGDEQAKLQQEKTDFAIEQIEQQKEQAREDYINEQQGAYVDWQKQSDRYGAGAEQMAASGLMGTGFSESSQVQMWTAYQNRVAVAKQSFDRAVVEYNNAINEARLSNNSVLAQIAHDTFVQKAEYALQGFQYKNDLLQVKLDKEQQLDNEYNDRWQDVLAQMNQENAMAEDVRQFNENMMFEREKEDTKNEQWKAEFAESQRQHDENLALDKEQLKVQQEQWQTEYDFGVKQFEESIRQFDAEMARLKAQDKKDNAYKIKQLELQKKEMQQQQKQWEAEMKEKKRQFNESLKKASNSSSGSSGGTAKLDAGTDEQKTDTPDSGQKKTYNTFQTNIANMMLKGANDKTVNNMAKQIEAAYDNGDLTEAQARKLLDQLN